MYLTPSSCYSYTHREGFSATIAQIDEKNRRMENWRKWSLSAVGKVARKKSDKHKTTLHIKGKMFGKADDENKELFQAHQQWIGRRRCGFILLHEIFSLSSARTKESEKWWKMCLANPTKWVSRSDLFSSPSTILALSLSMCVGCGCQPNNFRLTIIFASKFTLKHYIVHHLKIEKWCWCCRLEEKSPWRSTFRLTSSCLQLPTASSSKED